MTCRLRTGQKVDEHVVKDLVENESLKKVKQRNQMWNEIDEGLERLLVGRKGQKRVMLQETKTLSPGGFKLWTMHGQQLKELVREQTFAIRPKKVDVVVLSHYHIQMVMKRFGAWVVFSGHWTTSGR